MPLEPSGQRRGVGASIVRKEDDRHLRGRGQFVAASRRATQEVVSCAVPMPTPALPRSRSRAPHGARLHCGRTAADQADQGGDAGTRRPFPPWPPLAIDKVRYVGEAIAACVATRGGRRRPSPLPSSWFPSAASGGGRAHRANGSPAPVHEYFGDNLYQERIFAAAISSGGARR